MTDEDFRRSQMEQQTRFAYRFTPIREVDEEIRRQVGLARQQAELARQRMQEMWRRREDREVIIDALVGTSCGCAFCGGMIGGFGFNAPLVGLCAGGLCPLTTYGLYNTTRLTYRYANQILAIQNATTPEDMQQAEIELTDTMRRDGVPQDQIDQTIMNAIMVEGPGGEVGIANPVDRVIIRPPDPEGMTPGMHTINPIARLELDTLPHEGPDVPSFKKGGLIKRTGLAYVHKGEYVVPVNKVKRCNVCNKVK